jgi:hypothetical protein
MGAYNDGTNPGLINHDSPILNDDGPAKTPDAGVESLNLSSPQPGDGGSTSGPIASDLPDPLLGAVISSDYLPAVEHVLDQLTTSLNLFDVPCLDLDNPGHFDGGTQG